MMPRLTHLEMIYGDEWWGKSNILCKKYSVEEKKKRRDEQRIKKLEIRRKKRNKILKIINEYQGISFEGILFILKQTNKTVSNSVYRDLLTDLKIKGKVYCKKVKKNYTLLYTKKV